MSESLAAVRSTFRRKRELELATRRRAEAACAYDFLVSGDEHGPRDRKGVPNCVFPGNPCSRTYDPTPSSGTTPEDEAMYAGTGIGALYGLEGSEVHAWQLAGWNVKHTKRRRRRRTTNQEEE